MENIDVYCGWYRNVVISIKPHIVGDIVFEIPCVECGGTGKWDFFTEELPARKCNVCKGTGKQYLGI